MTDRLARIVIVVGVLIIALLAVIIVIIVTGDGDGTQAQPSTTTQPSPTTTTADSSTTSVAATITSVSSTSTTAATTSTSSTTTTTTVVVACPGPGAGAIPPGSIEAADVFGDFDEDGVADRFVVYEAGGDYWARVELAYGFSAEAPAYGPGVIDARAVDLGGPALLPIAVSIASPSSRMATFYAMFGCTLGEVPLSGGNPARFPVGATPVARSGVTCNPDGITVTMATVAGDLSGDEWQVSASDYLWVPGLGEFQALTSSIALIPFAGNEAAIEDAANFGC